MVWVIINWMSPTFEDASLVYNPDGSPRLFDTKEQAVNYAGVECQEWTVVELG